MNGSSPHSNEEACKSHDAAENISFVYSMLENCKLNALSFGGYIEDICTRIMHGDEDASQCLRATTKNSEADGSEQAAA